jgi:hypothetical protein
MTRIRSSKPSGRPEPLRPSAAAVEPHRPILLQGAAVELGPIVIHRSTYFGLTDQPPLTPDADVRALKRWEWQRDHLLADLPDCDLE